MTRLSEASNAKRSSLGRATSQNPKSGKVNKDFRIWSLDQPKYEHFTKNWGFTSETSAGWTGLKRQGCEAHQQKQKTIAGILDGQISYRHWDDQQQHQQQQHQHRHQHQHQHHHHHYHHHNHHNQQQQQQQQEQVNNKDNKNSKKSKKSNLESNTD